MLIIPPISKITYGLYPICNSQLSPYFLFWGLLQLYPHLSVFRGSKRLKKRLPLLPGPSPTGTSVVALPRVAHTVSGQYRPSPKQEGRSVEPAIHRKKENNPHTDTVSHKVLLSRHQPTRPEHPPSKPPATQPVPWVPHTNHATCLMLHNNYSRPVSRPAMPPTTSSWPSATNSSIVRPRIFTGTTHLLLRSRTRA